MRCRMLISQDDASCIRICSTVAPSQSSGSSIPEDSCKPSKISFLTSKGNSKKSAPFSTINSVSCKNQVTTFVREARNKVSTLAQYPATIRIITNCR